MNEANLRSLQEYLPQVGIKDFDIPYEEFKANMELPENREAFYNYISPQMEELGTFEDFELNLADPTPLDRKPVEIPADFPQNQVDYVNLEQPIQDEKQKNLDLSELVFLIYTLCAFAELEVSSSASTITASVVAVNFLLRIPVVSSKP